jgi:ubiquinone/menaquinone biosynthesis C-methylase UbiE
LVKTKAFDNNANAYDTWFDIHEASYKLEIEAVRQFLPRTGKGVEIGVGTGRFAKPLGIHLGVEPSSAMRAIAIKKGINVLDGTAEALPLENESCDYALFVTTICFLDSLEKAFSEAYRILYPGGFIVIGFIEKGSGLGKKYKKKKNESKFYRNATFYTVEEIVKLLKYTGFTNFKFVQTLFSNTGKSPHRQAVKEGYGEGSFIVLRAQKKY